MVRQARSQRVFSGKPEGPFCPSCTFIFLNERKWMKKSARVSEKPGSPGLPGLQVAMRLSGMLFPSRIPHEIVWELARLHIYFFDIY